MTAEEVRRVAGDPARRTVEHLGEYERIRARDLTGQVVRTEECWFYNATKEGAVGGACFFKSRVLDVLFYQHG
jgi:hypothetical protein